MEKPVILVPSPNVAEDHQTKNALALSTKDAAIFASFVNSGYKAVKDIYVRLGVDKMAQEEILRLTEEAMDAVEELDLGKVRYEMLKRFADKLIGRKN